MMTRDRSILEKNLLHLAVDFAEVNSAGGMTVLGVGDGDLRGSLWRGRGGVCRRCAMPIKSSTNRLSPSKPTPILDLSQDSFKE
ncbi:hypothetical protein RHMOL_Rhmol08G0328100 [Rhododendron molle]|uniref:Uncharacterized protein n=1 Tax=Rhododendron molle TaxID=49168 RepID=A0ACC0MW57_RHOML|nr:hypothetical protein RHMOL_Rhmol08G0328100 [Rhododendron molle]